MYVCVYACFLQRVRVYAHVHAPHFPIKIIQQLHLLLICFLNLCVHVCVPTCVVTCEWALCTCGMITYT